MVAPAIRRPSPKTRLLPTLARWMPRVLLHLAVLILAAMFGIPFFWTLMSSLKTPREIYVFPPQWLPKVPQWNNYVEIFRQAPLLRFARNTAIITALAMAGQLITASLVAYGFARFRFPGRDILFIVLLSTMMLPTQVTIIPTFIMFKLMGWLDTYRPLTIPAYFGGGAFAIFLFRQFFLTIPREFDEAAKIDGANSLWTFLTILIPLAKPVMITMAIFSFLGHWNDYFGPLIYLSSVEKFTLALGLSYFRRIVTAGVGKPTEHLMMAASTVILLPSLLVFAILQRYFTQGIIMSGIKG